MTTIAWDGMTLAADKLSVLAGLRNRVCKIYKGDVGAYAGCGDIPDIMRIARWLIDGEAKPSLDGEGGFGLFLENATGRIYSIQGKTPERVLREPGIQADGSGRDYALAAMACGKSAVEAVEIAARFCVWTGLGVDFYRIGEKVETRDI